MESLNTNDLTCVCGGLSASAPLTPLIRDGIEHGPITVDGPAFDGLTRGAPGILESDPITIENTTRGRPLPFSGLPMPACPIAEFS